MERESVKIITFRNRDRLAEMLAEKVLNLIRDSVIACREFNIALSGGSTPMMLFDHIAGSYRDIDPALWQNIRIYWVDERCVPADHPESNYHMADETLLRYLPHSNDLVFRMRGEEDPHEEAERYSRLLKEQLPAVNDLPAFDLVLLGMGNDGHTASIFPGQLELMWTDKLCDVGVHPESGQRRITLTGKVINNANHIYILVTGREKANMVARILCGGEPQDELPVAHIRPERGTLSWFLDDNAACLINKLGNPGSHRG